MAPFPGFVKGRSGMQGWLSVTPVKEAPVRREAFYLAKCVQNCTLWGMVKYPQPIPKRGVKG